jgi:hypothetical protein
MGLFHFLADTHQTQKGRWWGVIVQEKAMYLDASNHFGIYPVAVVAVACHRITIAAPRGAQALAAESGHLKAYWGYQ